jgi:hypothetical protein
MQILRRYLAAVLAFAPLSFAGYDSTGAAPIIATSGSPFQFHDTYNVANQAGGESAPVLTPWDFNGGFVATWLNYRSAADKRAFVSFYSSSVTQIFDGADGVSEMGAATGLTSGKPAVSAAPVMFTNGSSLVLFSANRRGAAAANARDIFAQRLGSGPWTPVGLPISVNTALANSQDSLLVTRLSNGAALTAFLTHAAAASTFDIRGRVLAANGGGITAEKALTVNTTAAQRPMALASLTTAGRSVLSYVVQSGATQHVLVQRLDAVANRIGNPVVLKTTTGAATYGAAGVAGLSSGRFIALWFVPGSSGTAVLRGRIFSATGVPGPLLTIGTTRTVPSALTVPKIAVAPDGKMMVVTLGYASGIFSIQAWFLSAAGVRQIGPTGIAASTSALTPASLVRLLNNYYVASWTQAATQPTATRAMGVRFHVFDCGRC